MGRNEATGEGLAAQEGTEKPTEEDTEETDDLEDETEEDVTEDDPEELEEQNSALEKPKGKHYGVERFLRI